MAACAWLPGTIPVDLQFKADWPLHNCSGIIIQVMQAVGIPIHRNKKRRHVGFANEEARK